MSFTLRVPTIADAAEIAELHVSIWREAYSRLLPDGFFNDAFIQRRRQMWNSVLADPHKDWSIQIAEQGGEIVGFAFVGPSRGDDGEELVRDRELFAIYVVAAHYGTGAGQALLDATLGSGPAMLWVAKANPRAAAFYRRNGFEFDGAEKIDDVAPMLVEVRMVR